MSYHNNQQFSTPDHDNDGWSWKNCAMEHSGAWWYKNCLDSNLNGKYFKNGKNSSDGVVWYLWKYNYYSFKVAKMQIKPNIFT